MLDGRNRPLLTPSAFDINTSIQRALVKAIALHGLGLYIYAGEDLPQAASPAAANDESAGPDQTEPHVAEIPRKKTPAKDQAPAVATISRAQQAQIHKLVLELGVDLGRLLAYFGVNALQDIPATD